MYRCWLTCWSRQGLTSCLPSCFYSTALSSLPSSLLLHHRLLLFTLLAPPRIPLSSWLSNHDVFLQKEVSGGHFHQRTAAGRPAVQLESSVQLCGLYKSQTTKWNKEHPWKSGWTPRLSRHCLSRQGGRGLVSDNTKLPHLSHLWFIFPFSTQSVSFPPFWWSFLAQNSCVCEANKDTIQLPGMDLLFPQVWALDIASAFLESQNKPESVKQRRAEEYSSFQRRWGPISIYLFFYSLLGRERQRVTYSMNSVQHTSSFFLPVPFEVSKCLIVSLFPF